jgi:hypothetical protein
VRLVQLGVHFVDFVDEDDELPHPLLRQAECVSRCTVPMSRAALQEDVYVCEAEHRAVLVFMLQRQPEDIPVERLRALEVADDQIDGADLLLPFSHFAPLSCHA